MKDTLGSMSGEMADKKDANDDEDDPFLPYAYFTMTPLSED